MIKENKKDERLKTAQTKVIKLLNIILTSQTNTCHTHIFTGDHDVVGVHIFDGK
jgi:hypothetical protein